jgi:ABC-type uncharacterized transport system permease subunit
MSDSPSAGQLALIFAATAVFVVGGGSSLMRLRTERVAAAGRDSSGRGSENLRVLSKVCMYVGVLLCMAVLAWHGFARGTWRPLEDNFEALVSLAFLLTLFVAYTQRTHPLRGLDWFMMPIVVLLLLLAAVFGKTKPHAYLDTTWSLVHVSASFGGFVLFAIAGSVGGLYLYVNRRLRNKRLVPGQGFGSLERLEHLTLVFVTLGFALLTIGLVTGLVRVLEPHGRNSLGPEWYRNPKVWLTFIAWCVYALVLHSPINPAFRGKRMAFLSVIGFVLMIGTFVAVQFMPAH